MFNTMAMGMAVAAFGAFMARMFQRNHEAMVRFAEEALAKAGRTIGTDEATQARYHQHLMDAVAYVDRYVNDPRFWRNVARQIISIGDPARRAALLAQFDFQRAEDFLAENLPPEIKEIVDAAKQRKAEEVVAAAASVALPPQFTATRDIRADVKDAVVVAKATGPEPEVTQEQLKALLEQHKALKAAWAAHK